MTTQTWSTVIDHSTDAGFRTWVAEYIAKVIAIGCVQTADTGQINTATVVRGAINTDAGYAVFRFNDTLQGTAPIFFKMYFGTGSTLATMPRIRIELGTASNGSGVLTGLGSGTITTITGTSAIAGTGTSRNSYACAVDGCAWVGFKVAGTGTGGPPLAFFSISRYTDNAGAPLGDGAVLLYNAGGSGGFAISLNYSTSAIYTLSLGWNLAGGNQGWGQASSLVGGVPQAFKFYQWTPRYRPNNYHCFTILTEVGLGVQFQAALTGTTLRNYLAFHNVQNTVIMQLAGIWE